MVDPVVRRGRHRQSHAGDVGFRDSVLAVVDPHVAVDVEEAHELTARCDAKARQRCSQLLGLVVVGQTAELASDGLDLRGAVEPQHATERLRVMLLDGLGALEAPERHHEQGQERRPQAVEGRADLAVDLVGDAEDAAGDEHWDGAEHRRTRHGLGVAEDRRRVVEKTAACQQAIPGAIGRVDVEAHRDGLGLGARRIFEGR